MASDVPKSEKVTLKLKLEAGEPGGSNRSRFSNTSRFLLEEIWCMFYYIRQQTENSSHEIILVIILISRTNDHGDKVVAKFQQVHMIDYRVMTICRNFKILLQCFAGNMAWCVKHLAHNFCHITHYAYYSSNNV